ncbi:MAG: phosphate ABC transporter substrate-binding protein [Marinobacter sp.]|jgi:ABC-type phosphate/phosphonate transport system substrate-binding protein|nr:phosphate ABC transporter substrate-binding protein [Marinobacter sp.]MBP54417.1 phosphate ABC transporter substrate-binding protein [Marinobacter sp.]|tara:strand:- start:1236 stop:2066 length:831 start_codon:yes stop_codon:yes gene_type:complete
MKLGVGWVAPMIFGLWLSCSERAVAESGELSVLTFGIVPQQASEKLARDWVPLMGLLSNAVGQQIRFATAPNIPEFERRLSLGTYDIAYMNPYHFITVGQEAGYRALVRQKNHQLRGIIVVSSDLRFESVSELAEHSIAFPAPMAFAATLITRSHLNTQAPGYKTTFVNSHDSVYRGVADGLFAAGGGIVRTLQDLDPDIQSKLEVLWLSPGYTSHAIATHPRVSDEARSQLVSAFLAVGDSESGRSLLSAIGMSGFQPADDSDWDDVRQLDIGKR